MNSEILDFLMEEPAQNIIQKSSRLNKKLARAKTNYHRTMLIAKFYVLAQQDLVNELHGKIKEE